MSDQIMTGVKRNQFSTTLSYIRVFYCTSLLLVSGFATHAGTEKCLLQEVDISGSADMYYRMPLTGQVSLSFTSNSGYAPNYCGLGFYNPADVNKMFRVNVQHQGSSVLNIHVKTNANCDWQQSFVLIICTA